MQMKQLFETQMGFRHELKSLAVLMELELRLSMIVDRLIDEEDDDVMICDFLCRFWENVPGILVKRPSSLGIRKYLCV